MQDKPLTVPANITLQFQLWPGFGAKEAFITGIVSASAILIAVGVHFLFQVNEILCTFGVFGAMAFCIMLVQKVENNMSLVDHLGIMIRFNREQQRFMYYYERRQNSWPSKK